MPKKNRKNPRMRRANRINSSNPTVVSRRQYTNTVVNRIINVSQNYQIEDKKSSGVGNTGWAASAGTSDWSALQTLYLEARLTRVKTKFIVVAPANQYVSIYGSVMHDVDGTANNGSDPVSFDNNPNAKLFVTSTAPKWITCSITARELKTNVQEVGTGVVQFGQWGSIADFTNLAGATLFKFAFFDGNSSASGNTIVIRSQTEFYYQFRFPVSVGDSLDLNRIERRELGGESFPSDRFVVVTGEEKKERPVIPPLMRPNSRGVASNKKPP